MSDEPKNAKTDPLCSDEEALQWLRDGTPELVSKAMECLYRRLQDAVRNWVVSKNGSRDDGHDALTEALITLTDIVQRGKYRDEGKLVHFLFRIAQFKFYDICRGRGGDTHFSIEEIFPGGIPPEIKDDQEEKAEENARKEALLQQMMQCFDRLDANCRERLERYWFKNESHEEIAKAMGDANARVSNTRKSKCQKKLKDFIKGE